MGEDPVEWPGDAVEIERVDKQAGVADLAPSPTAHEPVELLFRGAIAPRRHLLKRPKSVEIVVDPKDLLDPRRTERADQLLLQIGDAHEEAEPLHVRTPEPGAEAGALECPSEDRFLAGIAKARKARAVAACTELLEELPDAMCASEALDANARGCKVDAAPLCERFDCDLVTLPLDDHYGAQFGPVGCRIHRPHPDTQVKTPPERGLAGGRYWARTSDPQLVEPANYFDPARRSSTTRGTRRFAASREKTAMVSFGRGLLTSR
jgi:hypothetical protein